MGWDVSVRKPSPWGRPSGWRASATALLAMACLWACGCGSDEFVPPPSPELSGLSSLGNVGTATTLGLIVSGERTPERETLINTAMNDAGRAKVILLTDRAEADAPPAKQAQVIRKMLTRGIACLMIEPEDAPEVTEALAEVRARRIPLVLVGNRVEVPAPSIGAESGEDLAPIVVVDHAPYVPAVRKLAEAIVREAGTSGLPPDVHALICVNTAYGRGIDAQAKLLVEALAKAGIAGVEIVPFTGEYTKARDALNAKLEADPKAQILIVHEDQGLSAMLDIHTKLDATRKLLLAGVLSFDRAMNASMLTQCCALVDRNVPGLARQAFQIANRLAQGERKDLNPEIILPLPAYGNGLEAPPTLRPGERTNQTLARPGN